ncbi:hypothetical protein ACIBO5_52095 [Nonomuraea angiospora]|uniref:hypothetical protein n=1 Tax=Nonomuraea angiospora TaxID=46172 RepID=UPI0029A36ACA|nr:hypothetical protein [Nonomuraea angiospora]MDX3110935.1 hypothetical protein [Nonomuraea angiospora]
MRNVLSATDLVMQVAGVGSEGEQFRGDGVQDRAGLLLGLDPGADVGVKARAQPLAGDGLAGPGEVLDDGGERARASVIAACGEM